MSALTREERETVIIVNDLGELSVWSTSPVWTRKLTRTLGQPTHTEGETDHWEGLSLTTHSLRVGRRRAPRELTPEARAAAAARMRGMRKKPVK